MHEARRSGVHLCAEFEFGGTLMRSTPLGVYLCAQVRRQGYTYANPSRYGGRREKPFWSLGTIEVAY